MANAVECYGDAEKKVSHSRVATVACAVVDAGECFLV